MDIDLLLVQMIGPKHLMSVKKALFSFFILNTRSNNSAGSYLLDWLFIWFICYLFFLENTKERFVN